MFNMMKKIEAIVKPLKLDDVKVALKISAYLVWPYPKLKVLEDKKEGTQRFAKVTSIQNRPGLLGR